MTLNLSNWNDIPVSPVVLTNPVNHGVTDIYTRKRVTDALYALRDRSDSYKKWIDYGHAIKRDAPDLKQLWMSFSAEYPNFKLSEAEAKWDSFNTTCHNTGNVVTLGTILYDAMSVGDDTELECYTFGQLQKLDLSQSFLIDDILVEGDNCLVFGASKSLKTTLMLLMMLELARGGKFLGQQCKETVSFFCTGETQYGTIRATANAMIRSMNPSPDDIEKINRNFVITSRLPKVGGSWKPWQRAIEKHGATLCAVDPAYKVMPADNAGNVQAQGRALDEIEHACLDAGAQLMLATHTRKGALVSKNPPKLSDIAWTGYEQWAASWCSVCRTKEYVPRSGQHLLKVDIGGRADHGNRYALEIRNLDDSGARSWSLDYKCGSEIDDALEGAGAIQTKLDQCVQAFTNEVALLHDEVVYTKTELRNGLGLGNHKTDTDLLDQAIVRLVGEGVLKREGSEKRPTFKVSV